MKKKVKLVRIDNRLLHATVALNWNSFVNANHIAVVDSFYENDPFLEKVMQLCLPKKVKVTIFSASGLVDFLNQETSDVCNLIILFKDISTCRETIDNGLELSEVQLPYPASRMMLKKLNDYFTEDEIKDIRFIQSKGTKFFFQTSPMDTKDYSIFK